MQGIPKTYNFQRCTDAKEFCNMMKQNNIELLKYINLFSWYEFQSGEMFVIYKNDIRIGYLCLSDIRSVINTLYRYIDTMKDEEDIHIKTHGKDQFDKSINLANKHIKLFEHAMQYTNASHMLDIGLLEIIKEHRSFNTIKVVFNFIKEYCIKHKFDFAFCGAKNEAVARLYRIGGFKYIPDTDNYICMYLAINQKDFYEVTEKLKNKYKKNLFENMKNTKKLYEHIMTSVAKEVKKAINEGEDYNEEIDIQGDTERWCDVIDEYLWNQIGGSADANTVLALFSTLVYLDQLDDEEVKDIAEAIMEQIDNDEEFDNPPVDEVFFEAVAEKIKDSAEDWCADVVRDWKLNQ